jgi:hypothetical protein
MSSFSNIKRLMEFVPHRVDSYSSNSMRNKLLRWSVAPSLGISGLIKPSAGLGVGICYAKPWSAAPGHSPNHNQNHKKLNQLFDLKNNYNVKRATKANASLIASLSEFSCYAGEKLAPSSFLVPEPEPGATSLKFWNSTFDKGRLKNFVSWFLKNYGERKTIELLEQFKNLGFGYATQAGVSLGIDDLLIPPEKMKFLSSSNKTVYQSNSKYKNAKITAVEKIQLFIDTWNETSENLKKEVVRYFEKTNIFNPVYMMAFSGARGNISQVRQLVGMRGLMSDPQGNIIDFPIQSNFREGLTLTEYIISTYGARKGIVDTALRTATAGYLTRRLVDVAQHVMISLFDCKTNRGIFVFDMKEGNQTLSSFQSRLVGRVLANDMFVTDKGTKSICIGYRNQEISNELATKMAQLAKKAFVRSPLTCQSSKFVCQLCYGWSLSRNKLVSLGEAVGVIAGQSIGEPGTQLTMRTFHTGGVFSGGLTESVVANYDGWIEYLEPIPGTCIRTLQGKIAFLTKAESSFLLKQKNTSSEISSNSGTANSPQPTNNLGFHKIPGYAILFARHKQFIFKKQILAQFSSGNQFKTQKGNAEQTVYADLEGEIFFNQIDLLEQKSNYFMQDTLWKSYYKSKIWILAGKIYQNKFHPLRLDQSSNLGASLSFSPKEKGKGEGLQSSQKSTNFLVKNKDFVNKKSVFERVSWQSPNQNMIEFSKVPTFLSAKKRKTLNLENSNLVVHKTKQAQPQALVQGGSMSSSTTKLKYQSKSDLHKIYSINKFFLFNGFQKKKFQKNKTLMELKPGLQDWQSATRNPYNVESKSVSIKDSLRESGAEQNSRLNLLSSYTSSQFSASSLTETQEQFNYSSFNSKSLTKTWYKFLLKYQKIKTKNFYTLSETLGFSQNLKLQIPSIYLYNKKFRSIFKRKYNLMDLSKKKLTQKSFSGQFFKPAEPKDDIEFNLQQIKQKNRNLLADYKNQERYIPNFFKRSSLKIIEKNPVWLSSSYRNLTTCALGQRAQSKELISQERLVPKMTKSFSYKTSSNFNSKIVKFSINKKNMNTKRKFLWFDLLTKKCLTNKLNETNPVSGYNPRTNYRKEPDNLEKIFYIYDTDFSKKIQEFGCRSNSWFSELNQSKENQSNQVTAILSFNPSSGNEGNANKKEGRKIPLSKFSKENTSLLIQKLGKVGSYKPSLFPPASRLNSIPLSTGEGNPTLMMEGIQKNKFSKQNSNSSLVVSNLPNHKLLKTPLLFLSLNKIVFRSMGYIFEISNSLSLPSKVQSTFPSNQKVGSYAVAQLAKDSKFWFSENLGNNSNKVLNVRKKFQIQTESYKILSFFPLNQNNLVDWISSTSGSMNQNQTPRLQSSFSELSKNSSKKPYLKKVISPYNNENIKPNPSTIFHWFPEKEKTESGLFIWFKSNKKWNFQNNFWIQKKRFKELNYINNSSIFSNFNKNSLPENLTKLKQTEFKKLSRYKKFSLWQPLKVKGQNSNTNLVLETRPLVDRANSSSKAMPWSVAPPFPFPVGDGDGDRDGEANMPSDEEQIKDFQNFDFKKFSVSTEKFYWIPQQNYNFSSNFFEITGPGNKESISSPYYPRTTIQTSSKKSNFQLPASFFMGSATHNSPEIDSKNCYIVNRQGKKKEIQFQISGLTLVQENFVFNAKLDYSNKAFIPSTLETDSKKERKEVQEQTKSLKSKVFSSHYQNRFFLSSLLKKRNKQIFKNSKNSKQLFKSQLNKKFNNFILDSELKNLLLKNLKKKFLSVSSNFKKTTGSGDWAMPFPFPVGDGDGEQTSFKNQNISKGLFLTQNQGNGSAELIQHYSKEYGISSCPGKPSWQSNSFGEADLNNGEESEDGLANQSPNFSQVFTLFPYSENNIFRQPNLLTKKNFQTSFYSKNLTITVKPGWVYVFSEKKAASASSKEVFSFHQTCFKSGHNFIHDVNFEQHPVYIENCIFQSFSKISSYESNSVGSFLPSDWSKAPEEQAGPSLQSITANISLKKFSKKIKNQNCRYIVNKVHSNLALLIRPIHSKILPNSYDSKTILVELNKNLNNLKSSYFLIKDYHSNLLNKQFRSEKTFLSGCYLDFQINKISPLLNLQEKALWFHTNRLKTESQENTDLESSFSLFEFSPRSSKDQELIAFENKDSSGTKQGPPDSEPAVFGVQEPSNRLGASDQSLTPEWFNKVMVMDGALERSSTTEEDTENNPEVYSEEWFGLTSLNHYADLATQKQKTLLKNTIKKNFMELTSKLGLNTNGLQNCLVSSYETYYSYKPFYSNSFQSSWQSGKRQTGFQNFDSQAMPMVQISSKLENSNSKLNLKQNSQKVISLKETKLNKLKKLSGAHKITKPEPNQSSVSHSKKPFLVNNIYPLPFFKWFLMQKTAYLGNQRFPGIGSGLASETTQLKNYSTGLNNKNVQRHFSKNSFLFYRLNLVLKNQTFANTDILSPFQGEFIQSKRSKNSWWNQGNETFLIQKQEKMEHEIFLTKKDMFSVLFPKFNHALTSKTAQFKAKPITRFPNRASLPHRGCSWKPKSWFSLWFVLVSESSSKLKQNQSTIQKTESVVPLLPQRGGRAMPTQGFRSNHEESKNNGFKFKFVNLNYERSKQVQPNKKFRKNKFKKIVELQFSLNLRPNNFKPVILHFTNFSRNYVSFKKLIMDHNEFDFMSTNVSSQNEPTSFPILSHSFAGGNGAGSYNTFHLYPLEDTEVEQTSLPKKQKSYAASLIKLCKKNIPLIRKAELLDQNQTYKIDNFLTKYQKRLYKLKGLSVGKSNKFSDLRLGSFLFKGDLINPFTSFHKTGQILHVNSKKITLRYAQPFLVSAKGILHVHQGDPIFKNVPVITLPFDTFTTGDIVQGIPKVEQYLEARTTQNGRFFIYSLPVLLQGIFKRYCNKFPLDQAVSQSFLKIQLIIVDGVQRVYRSQGVSIADKHLEVIVKQMTSKVQIVHGGQTGFFPGELVDLEIIERINPFLMVKIQYEPVVLGITRASLEVESFLSAASFQQTTKILAKSSLYKKKDFLKGLKENILIGNLIPAGTGYMNIL